MRCLPCNGRSILGSPATGWVLARPPGAAIRRSTSSSKGTTSSWWSNCPASLKAHLHIEAKENAIRIASKKEVKYQEDASVHRRERIRDVFDRTIAIPIQIDPDRIRAEYRDGVLALFIPRAELAKPRTIKIT